MVTQHSTKNQTHISAAPSPVKHPRDERRHDAAASTAYNRRVFLLWRLIFITLIEMPGRTASMGDLVDILERDGHNLGRYPLRTVASAVGNAYVAHLFKVVKHRELDAAGNSVSIAEGRGVRDLL